MTIYIGVSIWRDRVLKFKEIIVKVTSMTYRRMDVILDYKIHNGTALKNYGFS